MKRYSQPLSTNYIAWYSSTTVEEPTIIDQHWPLQLFLNHLGCCLVGLWLCSFGRVLVFSDWFDFAMLVMDWSHIGIHMLFPFLPLSSLIGLVSSVPCFWRTCSVPWSVPPGQQKFEHLQAALVAIQRRVEAGVAWQAESPSKRCHTMAGPRNRVPWVSELVMNWDSSWNIGFI